MKLYLYGFLLLLLAGGLWAQEIKDIPEPAPVEKPPVAKPPQVKPARPPEEAPVTPPVAPVPEKPAMEKAEKPASPEGPDRTEKPDRVEKKAEEPQKEPAVIRLKTEEERKAEAARVLLERKKREERRVQRPVVKRVETRERPAAPVGPAQRMLERPVVAPARPPMETPAAQPPVLPATPLPTAEGLAPATAIAPALPTATGPLAGIADTHYLPEELLIPGLKVTHYTISSSPVANLEHGVKEGEVEKEGEGLWAWVLGKMTNSRTLRNIFIVAAIMAVFLVYRMRNTGQRIGL
ncbi:MAG: hypothetical protein HS115_03950 [Spirochaetales bacterium]|nr:hypothetical protein [Spirochaetales bacterium]